MKQTQREPKNSKEKIQKIQEIALDVLHQRSNILRSTMQNQNFCGNLDQMTKFYNHIIIDFPNHSPKIANYKLQILIGGTKSWEGFSTKKDGRRRFEIKDAAHFEKINKEFYFNQVIIQEEVEIKRIHNTHKVLRKVQENLLHNSELLEKIIGSKQVQSTIRQFFAETKFYIVKYTKFTKEYVEECLKEVQNSKGKIFVNPNRLYGLSSYDGLRTFVNSQLFDDAADNFDLLEMLPIMNNKEETKFEDLMPIYKLLLTLEHESCHNIPRWYEKNEDPLLIFLIRMISQEQMISLRGQAQLCLNGLQDIFKCQSILHQCQKYE